mmetsp:Transcript_22058/g.52495  ORF Transcript_22058/g.52495 Transcript_22058/m.52495 type:complete len:235 (+) Transcript_22058:88-792(+)
MLSSKGEIIPCRRHNTALDLLNRQKIAVTTVETAVIIGVNHACVCVRIGFAVIEEAIRCRKDIAFGATIPYCRYCSSTIRVHLLFLLFLGSNAGVDALPPIVKCDGNLAQNLILVPHDNPSTDLVIPLQKPPLAFLLEVIDQPDAKAFAGDLFPFRFRRRCSRSRIERRWRERRDRRRYVSGRIRFPGAERISAARRGRAVRFSPLFPAAVLDDRFLPPQLFQRALFLFQKGPD